MMQFNVTGADDLRRLTKQIQQAGDAKRIRRDLTKGLRAGAKPAVVKAKAAALALPDKPGNRSTGLRKRTAAAIGIQVRASGATAGVRVRISRARMGDQAGVVKGSNRGVWRHPVFGNREVWVTQTSRRNWFDSAIADAAPGVRRELKKVMDDIEHRLEHH